MALKGSLDDFNIVNILQMIKLEGKTGRLTLTEEDDLVKLTFDQGNIIYAEGVPAMDEARIESTLLNNGMIKQEEWKQVKKEHEDKLKPYWEILSKTLNSQALIELINRQVLDTVYYALRWKRGTYEFAPMKSIKYSSKVMRPMDVDGLLMEGCRIADEWSRLTAGIPPLDTFLVKNIMGEGEEEDTLSAKSGGGGTGDYRASLEFEILSARGVSINDAQVAVLSVVGAGKTIQELLDSARQGQYTTLEAVQPLLQLGVLKPSVKKGKTLTVDHTGQSPQLIAVAALVAIVLGGFFLQMTMRSNAKPAREAGALKVNTAQVNDDLKKIERAIKTYIVLNKTAPESLDDLTLAGALLPSDLLDPWNNRYLLEFEKKEKRLALYSTGPDVGLTADNIYLTGP